MHRSPVRFRVRGRPWRRRGAPFSGYAESVDAADRALRLQNRLYATPLRYMPFPPNWPVYIPKDKLANWFESYAEAMELNYWTATEFQGGTYDEKDARWTVTLQRADGS